MILPLKLLFFQKMGQPWPIFLFIFGLFKNNTIFTTNQCEKCPNFHPVYGAGIQTHNLSNVSCHSLPQDQGSRPKKFLSLYSN